MRVPSLQRALVFIGLWNRHASRLKAARLCEKWETALTDPELVADLVEIGGLLDPQTVEAAGGGIGMLPPDVLAFNAGRRAAVLSILARAQVKTDDINKALKQEELEQNETELDD